MVAVLPDFHPLSKQEENRKEKEVNWIPKPTTFAIMPTQHWKDTESDKDWNERPVSFFVGQNGLKEREQ